MWVWGNHGCKAGVDEVCDLEGAWENLGGFSSRTPMCCWEIPGLWHDLCHRGKHVAQGGGQQLFTLGEDCPWALPRGRRHREPRGGKTQGRRGEGAEHQRRDGEGVHMIVVVMSGCLYKAGSPGCSDVTEVGVGMQSEWVGVVRVGGAAWGNCD